MVSQSDFRPLTFGLFISLLFATCIANTTETPFVLNCNWTFYDAQRGYRPNCPIVSINGEGNYLWNTLSVAKDVCESLHDDGCNTVGTPADNSQGAHHMYLTSCPSTNPDELEWIQDTRWGGGMEESYTYFYECSRPTEQPTIDPTPNPTSEPTTKCQSSLNCTECIELNTGSFPQCLWHFVDQYCYYYKEVDSAEILQNDTVFIDHDDCIPTTNPTMYPSNNPTADPTNYPTAVPTSKPTKDPSTDPTVFPTLEPTTKCAPYSKCSDCLNMNGDGITWCLWQPVDHRCYFVAELDDNAEHATSYKLSCGDDDSAISAPQSISNTNGLFLIIRSTISVVLCVIMMLKIRKKSADKKENEEEIEMVQVNVRQKTIEVSESTSVDTEMEQIEGAQNVNNGNVSGSEEVRDPDTNTPQAAENGDV